MQKLSSCEAKSGERNLTQVRGSWSGKPRSSLVEGDEQLNRPTVKQLWNYAMHVLRIFFGFNNNRTAFCLGRDSLHLLLLESSMGKLMRKSPLEVACIMGSTCGTVGRAVAFNSRDPQFESRHQQILFTISCIIRGIERPKLKSMSNNQSKIT